MLGRRALVVVLLLAAACGEKHVRDPQDVVGTYAMGDAVEARRKARPAAADTPQGPQTLRELFESERPIQLSGSVDMLLELKRDGRFEYFGPLKMGDEQGRYRGHWTKQGETVHLRLDEPRSTRGGLVSLLVCPWRPGVVEYPLGRDAGPQVYYRLTDPSLGGGPAGGIRIGRRLGGD